MKALLPAVGLSMLAAVLFFSTAQAHDPYYDNYDPYIEAVPNPASYDPYYQLHVIHYQLYRRNYIIYPYYVRPVRVFVGSPVILSPSKNVKSAEPLKRR